MAINIRNREAEQLARQLAELTDDSITGAIVVALRERLAQVRRARSGGAPPETDRLQRLKAIASDAAGRWTVEYGATDHGDLLYDANGLPR